MNRTLLNMLSKCLDQNQSDWSTLLPFVLMAYGISVHESTRFTPYFLLFGHEMSLPLELMCKHPEYGEPSSLNKHPLERQEAIRKAFELVRRNTTAQQLRRNALYNRKVRGPVYKEGDCVLLHYPVSAPGCSAKLFSHWRSPYRINKCLNDVNNKIEEIGNGKQVVVQYGRLKRYHDVVAPTSLITERNPILKNVPTSKQSKLFDHSHCEYMTFPTTFLCLVPLLSLFTFQSLSPCPYPLSLDAPCRRMSHQQHRPLFPLTILSTHPHYHLVPRPLVAKRLSLELLQRRAPLRHLTVKVYNLASYRRQHLLVRPEAKHLTSNQLPLLPQTPFQTL